MSTFDIVIASLLLFGFIRGLFKGLFVEIASLVALVGGVYGAMHFSYYASDLLKEHVAWSENYIALGAFALTFISIVVVISLVGKLLTKIADFAALGLINKLLGGIFGSLKIALILSVVLSFFIKVNKSIPFVGEAEMKTSVLIYPVTEIAPLLFPDYFDSHDVQEQKQENEI